MKAADRAGEVLVSKVGDIFFTGSEDLKGFESVRVLILLAAVVTPVLTALSGDLGGVFDKGGDFVEVLF